PRPPRRLPGGADPRPRPDGRPAPRGPAVGFPGPARGPAPSRAPAVPPAPCRAARLPVLAPRAAQPTPSSSGRLRGAGGVDGGRPCAAPLPAPAPEEEARGGQVGRTGCGRVGEGEHGAGPAAEIRHRRTQGPAPSSV